MIVSWNWLKEYVRLDMPVSELERRLMMAGLNHEETSEVGGDLAIDLEVTSNRPDCLGHLGIAREVAVLFERELKLPPVAAAETGPPAESLSSVAIEAPELCPRYTARLIQGVQVGASPAWLVRRLATIGIPAINNVVDITNCVLMECGQPLHAFDLAKLAGPRIVVRRARGGERIVAIDHRTYDLATDDCVIADAARAVAVGGVMGGADTEVTRTTRDLLIESAAFDPLAIRNTARRLNLHSASSFRFERSLDPEGVDWASRRACHLILELAGGTVAAGVLDAGRQPRPRRPIVLRFSQLKRILGIDIPADRARSILTALGNREVRHDAQTVEAVPPSWRGDLAREIDLVEEVARIHGYDQIPEDVSVPMAASACRDEDRVLLRVREALVGAGFDEAYTLSLVEEDVSAVLSPWTEAEALRAHMPILRRADRLRRSLVPSLLAARHTNESLSNPTIELFEIANVYLPREGTLPDEQLMLAITTGGDFHALKGVLEAILTRMNRHKTLEVAPHALPLLDPTRSCKLSVDGTLLGFLGEVSDEGLRRFDLRRHTTVAEIKLSLLLELAQLVPRYEKQPAFPAVSRDLNLVVDEGVRWEVIAAAVRSAGGALVEELAYQDTYRDAERLGAGNKSILLSITLRDPAGTLTSQQADQVCEQIVKHCRQKLGAELRA